MMENRKASSILAEKFLSVFAVLWQCQAIQLWSSLKNILGDVMLHHVGGISRLVITA